MAGVLDSLVTGIAVETAWLPTIVVRDPFSGVVSPGASSWVLEWLRPRVSIELAGVPAGAVAPWGDPGPTRWPLVQTALIVAAGTVALLTLALLVRRR